MQPEDVVHLYVESQTSSGWLCGVVEVKNMFTRRGTTRLVIYLHGDVRMPRQPQNKLVNALLVTGIIKYRSIDEQRKKKYSDS